LTATRYLTLRKSGVAAGNCESCGEPWVAQVAMTTTGFVPPALEPEPEAVQPDDEARRATVFRFRTSEWGMS
jgi:hypothetical protein